MYSYFTFLELVKAISVHRAHRLLSESTLILCTLRNRPMEHVPEHEQLLVVTTGTRKFRLQPRVRRSRLTNDGCAADVRRPQEK